MSRPSRLRSHALLALALCTVAVAGCLGGSDDTPGAAVVPEAIAMEGCREILGSWELPYEAVEPYLPPGFETYAIGGPFALPTGDNVTMDAIAFSCTEPEEAAALLPWLYATPPDHLLDAEAEDYRLTLPCIGDAVLVDRLETWGVPCIEAESEMRIVRETPAAAQWAFEAKNDDLTLRLEGQGVDGDETSIEPVFGQFHAIDGELCAFTHLRLENHVHWRGEGFTMEAEGDVPFPVPDTLGDGLLALPDFWFNVTPVATAEDIGSEASACPSGQMPPGSTTLPTAEAPWDRTSVDTLPDGSPIPDGFELTGCQEQGGVFPAHPVRTGELPEGFSHVPSDPAGTTATIHWTGRLCDLEGDASYSEIWGFWEVQPPGHLAGEGADLHLLAFSVETSDPRQVDVYEAWRMDDLVVPSEISVEVLQDTPTSRTGHVRGDAGGFVLDIYTTMHGEAAPDPARTARVFGTVDGEVAGAMDLAWTQADDALFDGEATWSVDVPVTAVPPPPPEPGIGVHRWGEGYDLTVDRVDLSELRGP